MAANCRITFLQIDLAVAEKPKPGRLVRPVSQAQGATTTYGDSLDERFARLGLIEARMGQS